MTGTMPPVVFPRRLVMKRLCNVKRGDLIVGRDGWKTLASIREVVAVFPSASHPGELALLYSLPDCLGKHGLVQRGPNFYVNCVKF